MGTSHDKLASIASSSKEHSIKQRMVAADFRSTDVHVHGEPVWVSWSGDECHLDPADGHLSNLAFLSTAVHLNGELVRNSWPQQGDPRPIYLDSTSITAPDRRLHFLEDQSSKHGMHGNAGR